MKISKVCSTAALMMAVTGCVSNYSATPIAKNFPTSNQQKLQAASHWSVITDDLAAKLKANIEGKVQKSDPLYVSSVRNSPFNHAVELELIASLVNDGYTVFKTPSNAIKVDIDTQVIEFSPGRIQAKNIGVPTALVTGVWALAAVDATAAGVATAAVATGDASRWINSDNSSGETPRTEVIVSITVSNQNQYLAISKNTYYVTDTDKKLYEAAIDLKAFSIKGDAK